MKFIYPLYTVIFHYFENGIILLTILLYDMIFVIRFLKVNISKEVISLSKLRLNIILSFFVNHNHIDQIEQTISTLNVYAKEEQLKADF